MIDTRPSSSRQVSKILLLTFVANTFQTAAGGIVGTVSGTLREFLETAESSPYYQFKANLALSVADEENEPAENIAAANYFLQKAQEALKTAKEIYVHNLTDVQVLERRAMVLKDERKALTQRRKAMDNNEDEA